LRWRISRRAACHQAAHIWRAERQQWRSSMLMACAARAEAWRKEKREKGDSK